ncbi:MgtC/SapB family protein [uncultured Leifsonia sp.]|uniref:MgtC/SapB family protein n=1 Tax=uncultured Leifsonia sp. TaxID=340359 RepID=UPI0028D2BCC8|nr:MgtC/SapB family protein [uncultured Leifsonia sp.]
MAVWTGGAALLTQLLLLVLAFVLSAVIGIERERQYKSAGLRTHILVGLGAAMFTLVSAYGFTALGMPATDPSRIAAQVVTGIGFVGAGVIFVNRGNVVGLTTAASIWVTAAVGMACGAGMPLLAIAGAALHLIAVGSLPMAERMLRRRSGAALTVRIDPRSAALPELLERCEASGAKTRIEDLRRSGDGVEVNVHVRGRQAETDRLVASLGSIDGVLSVAAVAARP